MTRVRRLLAPLALAGLLALPGPARAVLPDEVLPDARLEARARAISSGLRCLVCQNQSIDDSGAELARDLRLIVRERLKAGDSDEAVDAYLAARYGAFILLRPPFQPDTLLLWGTPVLVLAAGAVGLLAARRRITPDPVQPLDASERARLDALLDAADGPPAHAG